MNKVTIEKLDKEVKVLKVMQMKPNYAELARMHGIDYRTVKRYYENDFSDNYNHRNKPSTLDKYDDIIREKMTYPGIKISAIYNYLQEEHDYKGSYSSLTRYIRIHNIKKVSKPNGRVLFETELGEQTQFDWVEDITMVNKYGVTFNFNVFSAELACSRFHFFCYSETKTREDVMRCLIKAFEYFGGTTKGILTDNMSSIVSNNKFVDEFKSFAKDFNITLNKCKVKHCYTKGKVEVRNKFMKWLIPYNNDFETEEELIKIINKINLKVNDRFNERLGAKPIMIYQKEKEYLSPLPSIEICNYYFDLKIAVKVTNVSTIYYKGCQYSVPQKFINKTLKAKEIDNKLYIYDNTNLIVIHDITGNKVNYTEEHYKECLKKILPNKSEEDIESLARKNLDLFDKLSELGKENQK